MWVRLCHLALVEGEHDASPANLQRNKTMITIDLTSADKALAYLRSLPINEAFSLPGYNEINTEGDAVRAITGNSANDFAKGCNRWEWTAGELVEALAVGATVAVSMEGQEAEVVRLEEGGVYVRFEDGEEGSYSFDEVEF